MNRIARLFLLLLTWMAPLAAAQQLTSNDIPRVMERLFHLHIDHKEFNTTIVRRMVKLYIEQFDPDKSQLLDTEIGPYLSLSDSKARAIQARLEKRDYSDFHALNQIFAAAQTRTQQMRAQVARDLIQQGATRESIFTPYTSSYAQTEADLLERQRTKMTRFFLFHQERTSLNSQDRRSKVIVLYEKRVLRSEASYLFLKPTLSRSELAKAENYQTLKILKSFAKSLDTHTSFFSTEEASEMRASLEKQFEGVGVVLSEGVDGVQITDVVKGSPAAESGKIQVNDLLVEIDGHSTSRYSFDEVLELLKKSRSDVRLGFQRDDKTYHVTLQKRPIAMDDDRIQATYERVEGGVIGKISLYSFYENQDGVSSEKDIREAIRRFREVGELKGLILDLRNNPGGYLTQAVKVAGLFVQNGVVVISKYGRDDLHYLRNVVGKALFNGPLVVLTSQMSASASEIVAQALQDFGVAVVVGDTRTFGKGSIQFQTVTDERSDLYYKVTVGKYYTVSGRTTQIEGVKADIVVPTNYAPYSIGERYLEYPLQPDTVEAAYTDPLTDLDPKTRLLFERRYMPQLQRVVSFWRNRVAELSERSAARIAQNPQYQAFLREQEQMRPRLADLPPNTIGESYSTSYGDLSMEEATHILNDMIEMEAQASDEMSLQMTGSDN